MIHKIEKLTSIGKFRNYLTTDIAFKKLTLIYGDNGVGKTTLTTILRALTQNKSDLIRRRKSTNQTTNQAIQIVERNAGGDIHHYPGLDYQITEHNAFNLKNVKSAIKILKGFDNIPEETIPFLKDWWTNHILKIDMEYKDFISKQ